MAITATKLLDQARSWIGCNERNGSFKVIIDTYNAHKPLARNYAVKYTDEWCATFVSACAIKCNATDIIPTECGCEQFINLCKAKGIWQENENVTPKPGWIILYDWQDNGVGDDTGWADHIGIVERVSNGVITTIEGNISELVGRKTLKVNDRYIRGYAAPKYDGETVKPTPTIPVIPTSNDVLDLVVGVMQGKYGNGEDRKKALGNKYTEVQNLIDHVYISSDTVLVNETKAGKYGNGETRKIILGNRYKTVQAIINKTY